MELPWRNPFLEEIRDSPRISKRSIYKLYEPFPTDIYYTGNLIREHFLGVSLPEDILLDFFSSLAKLRISMYRALIEENGR